MKTKCAFDAAAADDGGFKADRPARPEKSKVSPTGHRFSHYYSIEFKPAPLKGAADGKPADVFNFQALVRHARDAAKYVMEFLVDNSLLHLISDIRPVPNENRMIIQCPDELVAMLEKLPCVDSVRPLSAAELRELASQSAPRKFKH